MSTKLSNIIWNTTCIHINIYMALTVSADGPDEPAGMFVAAQEVG